MRLYTCCGVGQEYVGTIKEFAKYFEDKGMQLCEARSKKTKYGKLIDLIFVTPSNVYQDVTLYPIKKLPVKWN